ncbi:MAG: hypothetical protein LBD75_06760 [Candidatus Peribacteria bacterium]|nr:hypothetical protein [Candidatus Peribacteria bacterium]
MTATTNLNEDCTQFSDLIQAKETLQPFIIQACQRALMGYWANGKDKKSAFSPNVLITKAEVATVISRLLRGTTYAGTEEFWYHSHLLALKKAGIMVDDKAPQEYELKREVLTILQKLQILHPPKVE